MYYTRKTFALLVGVLRFLKEIQLLAIYVVLALIGVFGIYVVSFSVFPSEIQNIPEENPERIRYFASMVIGNIIAYSIYAYLFMLFCKKIYNRFVKSLILDLKKSEK